MNRAKTDARLICYASIIVMSLGACSHHGAKPKTDSNITDSAESESTSGDKSYRGSQSGKGYGKWARKKDKTLASGKGTSPYDNLWDRLFDLYDLPPIEHEDIDRELNWFVSHPTYIDRVQSRAEPFLYSIVKQVEKQDIPGEIALLPVIESAFQPHAVSPANAAGIWQFIPSTGRVYGLKRSKSYDGRRDIYASTKAAIKYLKKLRNDFNGDWLLAIAAYNCGEGAVGRAIQKNMARGLPTDFWSLDLPQETRSYVPRLLAVAKLFSSAGDYGIDLHQIPNTAKFKPVKVNTQLDLAVAADAANISIEKFRELNPGFRGQFTDVEGSYHLFIPAEKKAAEFRQELERLTLEGRTMAQPTPFREENDIEFRPARTPDTASYKQPASPVAASREPDATRERDAVQPVQKPRGELTQLKAAEKASAPVIRHDHDRLEPKASAHGLEKAIDRHAVEVESSTDRPLRKLTYTVQPGETLWAVARKHSVDVGQLAKLNSFPQTTEVKAGQKLVINTGKVSGTKLTLASSSFHPVAFRTPSPATKYVIREGDTLFSISRRFKVSVTDLRKWNGSNIEKQIWPGKNITVQSESN